MYNFCFLLDSIYFCVCLKYELLFQDCGAALKLSKTKENLNKTENVGSSVIKSVNKTENDGNPASADKEHKEPVSISTNDSHQVFMKI